MVMPYRTAASFFVPLRSETCAQGEPVCLYGFQPGIALARVIHGNAQDFEPLVLILIISFDQILISPRQGPHQLARNLEAGIYP